MNLTPMPNLLLSENQNHDVPLIASKMADWFKENKISPFKAMEIMGFLVFSFGQEFGEVVEAVKGSEGMSS